MSFASSRVSRAFLALALAAAASLPAAAQEARPVRILTNWFAQADQAGYWQAARDGLGAAAGLAITVQQGGPKIQTIPQVASGQAEFGIANADDVLLARLRGAPVRAVFAHLDHVPYTLVYHADPAVTSLADLAGRTVAVSLGNAYWEWTKRQFGLKGLREIPVTGDLSLFRNDPKMVQQGYSLFLPARMRAAGLDVGQFRIAELGCRPYSVLFTTDELIRRDPALVKATLEAVREGWRRFAQAPQAIRPVLLEMNRQIQPEVHDAAVQELLATQLPADAGRIGCMSGARWRELAGQLRSVDFPPAGFDETQAYDAGLLAGCGS